MGNYSDKPESVRVDFFKDSGKWYTTEAIRMIVTREQYQNGDLIMLYERSLFRHLLTETAHATATARTVRTVRLAGMWAVCLDPYHAHGYPLMRRVPHGACVTCPELTLLHTEGATICKVCADGTGAARHGVEK